jgi:hypothetical protein
VSRLNLANILVDNEHMTNRPRVHRFTVVNQTSHWKLKDGAWWRRSVIRTADGALRVAYVYDGEYGAAVAA